MNPDFRDILSAFSAAGVEYLVVGAYAMAAHGIPRATGDIDLWVRCGPENAAQILRALTAFGAPLHEIATADFLEPGIVFQIGVPPRRIDLLTAVDGLDFESAWADRIEVDLSGVTVPVLSRSDLITNKRAAGRPKDRADLRSLERRG